MKKFLFCAFALMGCNHNQSLYPDTENENMKSSPSSSHLDASGQLKIMTDQVVRQIRQYSQTGTIPWDYQTAVKDLPVQVGSLTKLIMQKNGERFAHGMSEQDIRLKIADELADIMSLVLYIAHELNIDIKEAWGNMLKSDFAKFSKRNR